MEKNPLAPDNIVILNILKNPLAPDNIEVKREISSNEKLKILDFYIIPIGTVKVFFLIWLFSNSFIFDKEKYVLQYQNALLYLRLELKLKEIHRVLELNQLQWLEPYVKLNTQMVTKMEKRCTN